MRRQGFYICIVYWGNIGIMENQMKPTIMENQMEKKMENEMETGIILGVIYWGNTGIMENQMETTIVYWGVYRDNGKENGSYHTVRLIREEEDPEEEGKRKREREREVYIYIYRRCSDTGWVTTER